MSLWRRVNAYRPAIGCTSIESNAPPSSRAGAFFTDYAPIREPNILRGTGGETWQEQDRELRLEPCCRLF